MYEIRRASSADIAPIAAAIEAEGVLKSFGESHLNAELSNPNALLLVCEKIGFCLFHTIYETADLIEIWCAPESRGNGIGRALLGSGIEEIKKKGAQDCFLEVAIDNSNAIALYEKMGFREISRRKQYYKRENGFFIDAISMQLSLDKI